MLPQADFLPQGVCYLEKYIDDIMRTLPEEAPYTWGEGWTLGHSQRSSAVSLCSGLSFSLPNFFHLLRSSLSLKRFMRGLESKANS